MSEIAPIFLRTLDAASFNDARRLNGEVMRRRLLHGIADAVAESGYAHTTIADIVAAAGVSRRSFYEHFTDREQCLVDAFKEAHRAFLAESTDLIITRRPVGWRATLAVSIAPPFEHFRTTPALVHLMLIDILGAGPAALAARHEVQNRSLQQLTRLAEMARSEEPQLRLPGQMHLRAAIGGLDEMARAQLLSQNPATPTVLASVAAAIITATIENGVPDPTLAQGSATLAQPTDA